MTVQTTTSRADYTGNGTTTSFAVPFYFLDNTHIQVLRTQISTGIISTLTLTTDYSVSGAGVPAGGTVTMVTAPTTDQKLSILRNVPQTQLIHYVPNDPFPAATHEQALDQLTMEVQQVTEVASRALTLPANTTAGSVSSSLPTPSGGKVIGWNSAGNALQNVDVSTLASIVAYGTANSDIFSGNGVQTVFTLSANPASINNLDVSISGVSQRPGYDYTWTTGTTVTFTTAPVAGTNNILIRYMQALAFGSAAASDVSYTPAGTGAVASTVETKLRESVSVTGFGADPTGVLSSSTAFQAAVTYLTSVGGGEIQVPAGTFLLSSSVILDSNVSIVGVGVSSVIKGGVSGFITATSKSNIEIRNVKFLNDNYRVFFDSCTGVRLIDFFGDGTRATTNVTNQGFWFRACDDVVVENPYLADYRDAIYCDANGATPCGTVTVRGGQISQTKHGSLINYPTGVYGVDVKKLYVSGTVFKNIKASSDSVAGGTGYGVYEGDGTDGNLQIVKVSDCKFIDDDGYATRSMIGVLISVSQVGMVDSCYFKGPSGGDYVGFIYGAREQTIQNCVFDAAACQLNRLTGTPKTWLVSNNMFKNVTGRVLRVCPDTPAVGTVTINGNTFRDCTYGPVTVLNASYVHATDNTIIECNTSAQVTDSYRAGINLDGPTAGSISGNLFVNGASGQMQYGVNVANVTNTVFTSSNRYVGMTVNDIRNANSGDYSIGTFTPTITGTTTAGTATYSAQLGKYTKIGRLVTCQIRLNWTAGTGTGNLQISGLPFTSANDNLYGTVTYGWLGDIALTASNVGTGYVALNATTALVYQYPVGGGTITNVPYDGAGNISMTVTYMT